MSHPSNPRRPLPRSYSCTSVLDRGTSTDRKDGVRTSKRTWKDVMRRSKPLPSPPSTVGSRSASSSPYSSTHEYFDSSSSGSDSEHDSPKMMVDRGPLRPATVAISHTVSQPPSAIRKPTLTEILSNSAAPPYTLSAFSAYLSHNHCLETLEFTMDASRYRKHYENAAAAGMNAVPSTADKEYIKMLWKRLLDAYIVPNGPREVNLPGDVRESLLTFAEPNSPPVPATLDNAVGKIHELMEDSVLMPFLNSVSTNRLLTALQPSEAMDDRTAANPHPPRLTQQKNNLQKRRRRANSPQSGNVSKIRPSSSYFTSFSLSRQTSAQKAAQKNGAAAAAAAAAAASNSPGSSDMILTDDSGSLSSLGAPFDPDTPPSTPPLNEIYGSGAGTVGGVGGIFSSPPGSNKSSRTPSPSLGRDEQMGSPSSSSSSPNMNAAWNRLSSKFGWKKRSAVGGGSSPVPEESGFV